MGIHLGRLLLFAGCIVLLQLSMEVEARPKEAKDENGGDDDDDSSSEETVEDSDETGRRRRRRRDAMERAAIPGLPDPATIIKIAQLFQSVGEQIVPILLEAVLPSNDAVGDRSVRDLQLLKNFKRTLELYSNELQLNEK